MMVTDVPTGPLNGRKARIVGTGYGVTSKVSWLAPVPPGVVTAMGPSVAPAGTVAVISVPRSTVKLAAVPLKVTAVAPVNPVPVIVTEVVVGPHVGVKLVTVDADAGRAVSPTINVTPTSGTNTRASPRFRRPKSFMPSTSLSPPLGMGAAQHPPIAPNLAYH